MGHVKRLELSLPKHAEDPNDSHSTSTVPDASAMSSAVSMKARVQVSGVMWLQHDSLYLFKRRDKKWMQISLMGMPDLEYI